MSPDSAVMAVALGAKRPICSAGDKKPGEKRRGRLLSGVD